MSRILIPLSRYRQEPVRWLWKDRIPLGAITVLDGDPGQGKSTLTYDLAARVTTGRAMPCADEALGPAGVILIQAEDGIGTKVLPSLRAAGADPSRILVCERRPPDRPLLLPDDLEVLASGSKQVGARLIVIDPLMAFLGANPNSDTTVRKALGPLAALAERLDLAVLLVRHLNKGTTCGALYRGSGSIGIVAAARSALIVGPDPSGEDPHQHVLAQTKSNLARAESLSFRTSKQGDNLGIEWLGPSRSTAQDVAQGSGQGERSALHEAQYVLYSILADGPVQASEAIALSARAGVAKRTLDRAKKALGVRVRKEGSGTSSHWTWELPRDEALLRPFKEKDLDDLTERLLSGAPGDGLAPREMPGEGEEPDGSWEVRDGDEGEGVPS